MEQERDYLVEQIRTLQQSNLRWKLAKIALVVVCPLLVLAFSLPAVQMARARAVTRAAPAYWPGESRVNGCPWRKSERVDDMVCSWRWRLIHYWREIQFTLSRKS
jgi:hypothetical protein